MALEDDTNNMTFKVSLVRYILVPVHVTKSYHASDSQTLAVLGKDMTFLLRGMTFYMLFREKFVPLSVFGSNYL